VYLLHCTWRCNILCSKHDIDMRMNEWMKSTWFVFKLKRKKQVLALILIEDLGFLPLVREIQRLSTRSATLHSWKDGISHTRGRNPRSSIGTRVRTYYSFSNFEFKELFFLLNLLFNFSIWLETYFEFRWTGHSSFSEYECNLWNRTTFSLYFLANYGS
jgi:hypothetical protein